MTKLIIFAIIIILVFAAIAVFISRQDKIADEDKDGNKDKNEEKEPPITPSKIVKDCEDLLEKLREVKEPNNPPNNLLFLSPFIGRISQCNYEVIASGTFYGYEGKTLIRAIAEIDYIGPRESFESSFQEWLGNASKTISNSLGPPHFSRVCEFSPLAGPSVSEGKDSWNQLDWKCFSFEFQGPARIWINFLKVE